MLPKSLSQMDSDTLVAAAASGSFAEGTCRGILRYHRQFVVSFQHAWHLARSDVGIRRKEVGPCPTREQVCICTGSEKAPPSLEQCRWRTD